jgi:hypothetical protein
LAYAVSTAGQISAAIVSPPKLSSRPEQLQIALGTLHSLTARGRNSLMGTGSIR